jgi:L-alanine-DL-glutamate epimerase-like enolase superfamily enzyme
MKIRDIEVINLRFEYPPERRFRYAGGVCTGRLTSLVKVHSDEGLVGIGSVYSHPDLVRTIIEDQLRPALVGENALEIEQLWNRCYVLTRWYGRKGAAVSALGGIDIALWDLKGKAVGKRICDMIGPARDQVPAYASGLLWKRDAAELREEAERHLAAGFRGMKMRLGRRPDYDRAGLRCVRDVAGCDVRLMVDGNARYSLDEARAMVPYFRDAGIFWLEEPFAPENPEAFLSLRPEMRGIPLAAGENEFGFQGFSELIDHGVVQIAQPDCCRCGGLTEALRISAHAQERGVRIAPHTWSDAVALTANMHLVSTVPDALTVEVDQTGNPFIDNLLVGGPRIEDGYAVLPEQPGLGIDLDEDVVAKYAVPRGELTPPGNYSDMVFR